MKPWSKKAWLEWQAEQTMLINEKHLSMMDPDSRKYLQQQMDRFLAGDSYDRAEGYVAPTEVSIRRRCHIHYWR